VHPGKLRIATRVRKETTLPIKSIAARLQMGSFKSLKSMLHDWRHDKSDGLTNRTKCAQLEFHPAV
jgi:hypothetical protein